MEAEGSQAVTRRNKRPVRIQVSDDESEHESPRANGKVKRRRSGPVDEVDSDLGVLIDEDEQFREANGHERRSLNGLGEEGEDGEGEDEDDEAVDGGVDGPRRPIGFPPEYDRGVDG